MRIPFTEIALIVVIITTVIVAAAKIIKYKVRGENATVTDKVYEVFSGLCIIYTAMILGFTLAPTYSPMRSINLIPFADYIANVEYLGFITTRMLVLNWLLFIPFGFLGAMSLKLKNKNSAKIILYGLILTLIIEITQYAAALGRAADIDDVILNLAGTITGFLIALPIVKLIGRRCVVSSNG